MPETWAQAFAQAREEREGAVAGGGAVAAGQEADLEVLGDGELGEEPAALRHPGDALPGDVVGGQGVEAGGVEADLAGGDADEAHDRLQRRRLAGAVAAHQAEDLAGVDGEGEAAQDADRAVAGVEVLDRERHGPR